MESGFSVVQVRLCPENEIIKIPARIVYGMKISEITGYVKNMRNISGDYQLSVIGPNSEFIPPPNMVIVAVCLDLCFVSFKPNDRPRFYLKFEKCQCTPQPRVDFELPIVSDNNKLLYTNRFSIPYPVSESSIVSTLSKLHLCATEDFVLCDCTGTKADEISDTLFVEHILYGRYFIKFSTDKQAEDTINGRTDVIQELIDSERAYHHELIDFKDRIKILCSMLVRNNLLSKNNAIGLLDTVKCIHNIHSRVLERCDHLQIDFMTLIGSIFESEIERLLDEYKNGLALLRNARLALSQEVSNREMISYFNDFDELFMKPMEYITTLFDFFKQIESFTLSEHPDFRNVKHIMSKMSEVLDTIEIISTEKRKMLDLQRRIDDSHILEKQTCHAFCTVVSKKCEYEMYLLSDCLFIAQRTEDDKLQSVCSLSYDSVCIEKLEKARLVIRGNEAENMIYTCESLDTRDSFVAAFHQSSIRSQILNSKYRLTCEEFELSSKFKNLDLESHVMFCVNEKLFIYGGCTSSGEIIGSMRMIKMPTMKISTRAYSRATDPIPRIQLAHAVLGKMLYIWGGLIDNKPSDDFWSFDTETGFWSRIIAQGDVPPADFDVTLTCLGGSLLLVGGHNDLMIYRYVIAENRWTKVTTKSGLEIQSLHGHSSFVIDDESLLIICKLDETTRVLTLKDYGEEIVLTQMSGVSPHHGRMYSSACGSRYVVFDKIPYVLDIESQSWCVCDFDCVNDAISQLENYAICRDNGCIWIHGGRLENRVERTLYRVTLESVK